MRSPLKALVLAAPFLALAASCAVNPKVVTEVSNTKTEQVVEAARARGVLLRSSFDTDPGAGLGRFVEPGALVVDDAEAMDGSCRQYVKPVVVGAGNVEYDDYFLASTGVSGRLGIPVKDVVDLGVGGKATAEVTLRVKYKAIHKMRAEIADYAAFDACCQANPHQCTTRYVGEYLSGTGTIYYAAGRAGEIDPTIKTKEGVKLPVDAQFEVKDGVQWKRSITFSEEVYFAFSLRDRKAREAGWWRGQVPTSDTGKYFVGQSAPRETEDLARGQAMDRAREAAMKFCYGEGISTRGSESTHTSGSAAAPRTQAVADSSVQRAAEGIVRALEEKDWFPERKADSGQGARYVGWVLAFLPNAQIQACPGAGQGDAK